MNAHDKNPVDHVTGTETTGHEWDGISELNTPLPKWWLYVLYASIVFSIGYWVVYPAWPLVSSFTTGAFGWSSRGDVATEVAALQATRGPMLEKIAAADVNQIKDTPELLAFASAAGAAAFKDNCAPCHGAGGGGAVGFPNLNDDDWIWGGKLDDIVQTITHGIRSTDPDTRVMDMPAFGRDGLLTGEQITNVVGYVRSLSGLDVAATARIDDGKAIFAEQCAGCHGEDAKGMRDMGAPNLTDAIWLYGPDEAAQVNRVVNGGGAMMPAWSPKLSDATIKSLAVYVHSFGGGE